MTLDFPGPPHLPSFIYETHCVALAGLELTSPPASASQVLGVQAPVVTNFHAAHSLLRECVHVLGTWF